MTSPYDICKCGHHKRIHFHADDGKGFHWDECSGRMKDIGYPDEACACDKYREVDGDDGSWDEAYEWVKRTGGILEP